MKRDLSVQSGYCKNFRIDNNTTEISENHRIVLLDILRGLTFIGILVPNVLSEVPYPIEDSDKWLRQFSNYAFEGRFFPVFALLFGIGFFIFTQNAERKGLPSNQLFARRLLILLPLGICHFIFNPGEALLFFAIFGWLLFPLKKCSDMVLLIISLMALTWGVLTASFLMVPGLIALGFWLGRVGYVQNFRTLRKWTFVAWIGSFLLMGPFCYLQYLHPLPVHFNSYKSLAGLVVATFWTTSIILLPGTEKIFKPLVAFGKMALTNYIGQTVLILVVDAIHPLTTPDVLAVCSGICIFQILASNLWLKFHAMGPLEWLWRWGTYLKRPAWRRVVE